MISIRHLKHTLIAVVAAFSLLFMQLAAAAYVCSGTMGVAQAATTVQDMAPCSADTQSGCDHPNAAQAALCAVQAHAGSEIAPEIRAPRLPAAAPSPQPSTLLPVPDEALRQRPPLAPPGLMRVVSPALSIRNCCYRI